MKMNNFRYRFDWPLIPAGIPVDFQQECINLAGQSAQQKNRFFNTMKKLIVFITLIAFLCSCSLFRKSEKLGCKSDGRNVGAEKILAGDEKATKASKKAKYRGGRTSY